jgi:hypothetical protein
MSYHGDNFIIPVAKWHRRKSTLIEIDSSITREAERKGMSAFAAALKREFLDPIRNDMNRQWWGMSPEQEFDLAWDNTVLAIEQLQRDRAEWPWPKRDKVYYHSTEDDEW